MSRGIGKVISCCSMNCLTCGIESWFVALIAMICRSESENSWEACWKAGISALQGGHQEAQKFRMRGLPVKSANPIFWLSRLVRVKLGAEKPTWAVCIDNGFAPSGTLESQIQANPKSRIETDIGILSLFK